MIDLYIIDEQIKKLDYRERTIGEALLKWYKHLHTESLAHHSWPYEDYVTEELMKAEVALHLLLR